MNEFSHITRDSAIGRTTTQPATPEPSGVFDYATDIANGVMGGVVDAGNEVIALKDIFDEDTDKDKRYLPKIETKTTAGEIANLVTQIGLGIFGAGKVVKAIRIAKALPNATKVAGGLTKVKNVTLPELTTGGKVARGLAEEAIADFTLFSDNEGRLSDLIQSVPSLQNPLTEYLASDVADSKAEVRFKNALEGMFFGVAAEGAQL